jgi:hypothetical protein
LVQLQAANPDVCWGFLHNMPTDLRGSLPPRTADAMMTAEQRVRDESRGTAAQAVDTAARRRALETLVRAVRVNDQGAALDGLRQGSDHSGFCPAIRALLDAALTQPPGNRVPMLRALLSGG